MSILNQSIAPIGLPPVQASKGTTGAQEANRLAPVAVPLHGSAPAKSSQISRLKGASVGGAHSGTTAGGILSIDHLISIKHKPCYSRIRQEESCKTSVAEAQVQSFNPNMAYSFMDEGKMSMMRETQIDDDEDNRVSSKMTSGVLAVSVSSAVKLDDRQIKLITRKMQRLTGFMNLRLENTVDPSLLAGFVIRYSNDQSQVIDLSVKNQLAMVVAQLEHSDQESIAGYKKNKTSSDIKR